MNPFQPNTCAEARFYDRESEQVFIVRWLDPQEAREAITGLLGHTRRYTLLSHRNIK